jgi:RHS repeat-associated protein
LPFGSISLVYDAWGNVTDETRSVDLSSALGVTFADTLSVHSEDFTSEGNPMKVVEASGITTIHIPAYFGWRPFQVRAYHDESDFGSSYVTSFTYSYNAAGVPRSIRHFLRDNAPPYPTHFGRIVYYKRDKNGRLTEEYGTLSSSTDDKITQKYTYHGAGEIKTLASRVGGSTDKRTFTFGYDNQHQLTNADDDKGYSGLFTYSPQGRLTSAYIGATPLPGSLVYPRDVVYEYDSTDPEAVGLLKVASTGAEFADFEHDVNGNMTSRVLGSDQWNLVYDGEDRLRIREAPDGGEELYYYHDNARWLAVTKDSVGTVLSARLWFGNAEIRYDCASGTCIREKKRTTLRLGGMAVARFERDVATGVQTERLLQTNLLGHLLGVYSFQDPTGALDYNLEVGYQYGPFGEILEVKEFPGATTSAEDYTERFNGKELDEASGLSYYGYRYYDPLSLTWNRADPKYRFKPDLALIEPRRGALFNFSGNNPIRYVDSDGRDFKVSGKADDIYFHYNFDPSGPGEIETALLNPMDATAIFGAARIAQSRSSTIAGTRNLSHREEDAVRHALWSAISTAEIGSTDAKKFLDAHEKTGLVENQPPAEVIVDLHNNAVGRIVAENNKGAGLDKLTDAVLGALDAGLLITGNPNDNVVITEESKASLNKSSTGTISERYPIQPQTPSGPIDVEFIAPQ